MNFRVKIEITPKHVLANGVRLMPSMFPKDMRQASVPDPRGYNLVFRPDLIRKRLKEYGFTDIPAIQANSSFYVVIDKELFVACYDPHFIGCDGVSDFEDIGVDDDGFLSLVKFISLQ